MLITQLHDLLDAGTLARAQTIIASSRFVDGRVSATTVENKNNLEMAAQNEQYVELLGVIETAVRASVEFNCSAFPRFMTRPIISRYDVGMFFGEHVDSPIMGFMSVARSLAPLGANYVRSDLSMTLFLSPPASYDGGELSFDGAQGPMHLKLNAGSAILYPTGVRHSVTPVTRGVRHAAIFWIQTMYPTEESRRVVINAYQLMTLLRGRGPESPEYQRAEENFFNIARVLAAV